MLGVDQFADFGQGFDAIALVFQAFEQLLAGVRAPPEGAEFVFVLEQRGQIAVQTLDELGGGNGGAVGAPEAGGAHVLDAAFLAVGQLDAQLAALGADAGVLAADLARFGRVFLAHAGSLAADAAWVRRRDSAGARLVAAAFAGFGGSGSPFHSASLKCS